MSSTFQDYYTTLGVQRGASDDEIKRAYRKLAKDWHPDRHPEEERDAVEKKFKSISEANEVLSDPEKRERYDSLGENWQQGQSFHGGGGIDPEQFAQMFGGRGWQRRRWFLGLLWPDVRRHVLRARPPAAATPRREPTRRPRLMSR